MSTAFCCLLVFLAAGDGSSLKKDVKNHGPLDGHPVLVSELLQAMDLPEQTLSACLKVATWSQADWRTWYRENREKVDEFQRRIRELSEKGDRRELARVRKEKKAFMHTAPSLLRQPEPLQDVLSEEQYADFIPRLEQLRKDLHRPRRPPVK
jgi:hypothetical protein